MAKSFIAIEHAEEQVASVTLAPAGHEAWFRLFRAVVHSGLWAQLSDAACRTYIVLAESVNDTMRRDNGEWLAWPSAETVARRAGITRRSVFRATDELEAAKLLERRRGGGRKSTQYCLLPPSKWKMPATTPETASETAHATSPAASTRAPVVTRVSPVSSVSPVTDASLVTGSSSQARHGRHRSDVAGGTRQRKNDRETKDTSSSPGAGMGRAELALSQAGIGEPTRGQLLAEVDEEELLLRIEDWKNRSAAGKPRSVAWLVASIRSGYDLHPTTLARVEREKLRQSRLDAERSRKAAEAQEQRRQAAIDARVHELFDAMDDDELDEWKHRTIEEYTPALSRGLERADPRVNEKLKRRILGLLARHVEVS